MERFDLLVSNFNTLSEELKLVNKQLKEENKEFFNAIVENSTHFIAILQNEKYVFVNSAGLNLFQVKSSTNIVGKNVKETINPEFHDLIPAFLSKKTQIPETVKIKFKRTNGATFYCECNITSFTYKKKPAVLVIGRDISNEMKQRLKLRSEVKLRTDILNAFQEVIAYYSPEHTILWLNDAGKKQLGIKDDSYVGKLCYKMWFNAKKPCKTCPVVTRKIEPLERIVTLNGNRIWMIRHTPLFDNKGILTGYIEFRSDITEKENTKIELEKSHARQIQAELTNSFGNFEINLSTNSYTLSPGTINILGLVNKKNRNNSDYEFFRYIHPDDANVTLKYLEMAYLGEKKFDRIFKIFDANCVEKTIRGLGEVKEDPITGDKKFFAVVQDITRISNLENQVFDEREKYKMLAENTPFGLILTQNNRPVYINKTIMNWFGLESVSDLENTGFDYFFHPNDKKVANAISRKIKDNNVPSPVVKKLRFIDKERNTRHARLELKNNIIHGQNFVQIVITDITEDVIQEKKQKQIAADALYINQKNSILSEIETVLTKILTKKKFTRSQQDFNKIYEIINSYKQLDKDWKMLVANFEEVHPDFFRRLNKIYPRLSPIDIKHCACIKMNMDTKEIARFFNIKVTSVQIARVRIKKKMDLPEEVDLRSHILNF